MRVKILWAGLRPENAKARHHSTNGIRQILRTVCSMCAPHLIDFLLHQLHFLFSVTRHCSQLRSMSCQCALRVPFVPTVPAHDGALDDCRAHSKPIPTRPQTEDSQPRAHRCAREVSQLERDCKHWRNGEAWVRDLSCGAGTDRHRRQCRCAKAVHVPRAGQTN